MLALLYFLTSICALSFHIKDGLPPRRSQKQIDAGNIDVYAEWGWIIFSTLLAPVVFLVWFCTLLGEIVPRRKELL